MSLGNNIKKYRRELGITQEELAGLSLGIIHHGQVHGKREDESSLSGLLP